MKILIETSEDMILQEVAQHMRVKLGNPRLLYEIENPDLAAVAIALGGHLIVTDAKEDRAPTGFLPGEPKPEPVRTVVKQTIRDMSDAELRNLMGTAKKCAICDGPVPSGRRKTCSPECESERKRRYNRDYQRRLHEKPDLLRVEMSQPAETGDAVSGPSPLSPSV